MFTEFVLGQNRWRTVSCGDDGDDAVLRCEVNAIVCGDGAGVVVARRIDAFVLIKRMAVFGVVGRNETAILDGEETPFINQR